MKITVILIALFAAPDLSGQWQRYFAWWPVTVDAYDVSEIKDGHMSFSKWGWVERRWYTWADDETGERHEFWRYRLDRRSK